MPTVLLVRHGRTSANAKGILAGRTAGVALDATGRTQAARTAERLAVVPLAALVSSPLERCRQTSRAILERQSGEVATTVDRAITECDYGEWQGRALADLAKEDLWRTVQSRPSAVHFPGGETMAGMQARAVDAIRRRDDAVRSEHGERAVWAAVSHGDVIKSILADAFGMHLDLFQRIGVGPASVSIVRYGADRTEVVSTNSDAGDLAWLASLAAETDAAVGGGAGPAREHDGAAAGAEDEDHGAPGHPRAGS